MHKGNPYPYFPFRHVALGWFWPGNLPWKLVATGPAAQTDPWQMIGPLASAVSEGGEDAPDLSSIRYRFIPPSVPADMEVRVYCERQGSWPILSAVWRAEIWVAGIYLGKAWTLQDYPQRIVHLSSWENSTDPSGQFEYSSPLFELLPATYAQGGDPWA